MNRKYATGGVHGLTYFTSDLTITENSAIILIRIYMQLKPQPQGHLKGIGCISCIDNRYNLLVCKQVIHIHVQVGSVL